MESTGSVVRPLQQLPFVWPSPLLVAEQAISPAQPVFASTVGSAVKLYGLLCSPGRKALAWITERISPVNRMASRLILAVYPTGPTSSGDLRELLARQNEWALNTEFRIIVLDHLAMRSSSMLLFFDHNARVTLVSSADGELGLTVNNLSQIGTVTRLDDLLRDRLVNSIDLLWALSAPLTADTAEIPVLVPGEDEDGAGRAAWCAYMERCKTVQERRTVIARPDVRPEPGDIVLDPESGAVTVIDAGGKEEQPVSDDLGIPKLDALQRALAKLQDRGDLITIEAASRVPPVETPVKAEWFGVERSRRAGTFTQRTQFLVSPFEKEILRGLNELRAKPAKLLPAYSLPLSNGVRWMPKVARKSFEAELKQAQDEWNARIKAETGADVKTFVASRREKLRGDANALCARINAGNTVSEAALDEILREVTDRLATAIGASLMPLLSFSKTVFNLEETEFSNPWGQAHTLMLAAVTEPRKLLIKKSMPHKTDLSRMVMLNVFDDKLVTASATHGVSHLRISEAAKRHLARIETSESDHDASLRKKCATLWEILNEAP